MEKMAPYVDEIEVILDYPDKLLSELIVSKVTEYFNK